MDVIIDKSETNNNADKYINDGSFVCENKSYPHKTCECGYISLINDLTDNTCPICHSHINFTDSKLSDYIMLSPDISDFMELYRLQWIQENRLQ